MKNDSLVSIIMPAYNSEKYIKESIESVKNQTYTNWELVIVNDCSNDNTENIIKEYAEKDKRIKLYTNVVNQGVVKSRNLSLKKAKGEFIAFLDSDDIWSRLKLEKQINYMKKIDSVMSFTSYYYMNSRGMNLFEVKCPLKLDYKEALKGNEIGCLTVIIDRKKINNLEMPDLKHEDYATWLSVLKNGRIAHGIQENLASYRKLDDSLSSNKLKTIIWTWKIFRDNQKIGIFKSSYYLSCHLVKGIKKHYFKNNF